MGLLRFFSETSDWTVAEPNSAPAGRSLLAIALEHGVPIPFTCDGGACGACLVEVKPIGAPVPVAALTEAEAFLLDAMGKGPSATNGAAAPSSWRLACQYVVRDESVAVYFAAELAGW